MIIGIDASNLRGGGGVTHLIELLKEVQPTLVGFEKSVVWAGAILQALPSQPWLEKRNPPLLNRGLLCRTFWQRYRLSQAARDERCDLLFVPGGSYAAHFHPVVTMSQNLLPFDFREVRRFGFTFFSLKLLLLRLTQKHSFQNSDGVIFLTEYARSVVLSVTGKLRGQICIVPHGLNSRFISMPKLQRQISHYNDAHPYRVLYVSTIDEYKHQWHVVEAVAALRKENIPIVLDLVGSAYLPSLHRLNRTLDNLDPGRDWVHYHGPIAFEALHHHYSQADLGLFASSCENMPNILLETMASGLPIACSKRGPMPEIIGNAGVFFDPEQPIDIARALRELVFSPQLRMKLAQASYASAQNYSWRRCAKETFQFLNSVVRTYRKENDFSK